MELFKIFGTIAIDNSGANSSLEETSSKASGLSGVLSKIGGVAATAGKVIATGLAAGATAMGALVKQSIEQYAEYEQLVGGVETLFKESSDTVKAYADNAYKTAGLSANEYMETVTSFSASLLQGLDGDTAKAAEIANRAITDMSDNANKMGTSIGMIQNAYQGFAKQNYTMLDNLKLGYGGTQAEMARLINDSGVLGDTIKVTANTVNSVSFDKIIEAIGVIQDRMGITGTTAKEASTTIQGSISSMKSAWTNFMTGMADENQDFDALLGNLVDSVVTVGRNLVPRIQKLLPRLVEGVNQLITSLLPYIPVIIEELLPGIISGAISLMTGLVMMLPQILEILISQIPSIITQIGQALITAFPVLLQTVKDLFGQIWDYISLELLNTGVSFEDAFAKIQGVFESAWVVIQTIWNTIGQPIFDMVQNCVGMAHDAFSSRMPAIKEFVQNCFSDIKAFWENNLKPCFEAIGEFIKNVLAPIFESVFQGTIGPLIDTVFQYIKSLWNDTLKPVFTGITDFLTGVFTGNWQQAWDGIKSIVTGVVNGIISTIEGMVNGAINLVNGMISGINTALDKFGDTKLGQKLGADEWQIGEIGTVELPKLAEGGVLGKGQVGLLEGDGAEAVVPLDQNRAWITAVAKDMQGAIGGAGTTKLLEQILEALQSMDNGMKEKMTDAFASMKFDVNNREFARMVKAVN